MLFMFLSRINLVPSKYTMTVMIFIMMVSFYYFARHVRVFLYSFHSPFQLSNDLISVNDVMSSSVILSCTCFSHSFLSQVEKLARTLFLWKIEVHEQKEKVYEMRRWNEALVTNMLPEHVARHFLGSKKRDEVRKSVQATSGYVQLKRKKTI